MCNNLNKQLCTCWFDSNMFHYRFYMSLPSFDSPEWFNLVEDTVIKQYNKVKIKGEIDNSVLAAFLLFDKSSNSLKVLSLATGTKLMSGDQRERSKENGPCFVHDCHAEILAHRCFQLWCWNQIEEISKNEETQNSENSVFIDGLLKPDLSLHFYTSTPPCGDCCVHVDEKENTVSVETGAKPFGTEQNELFKTPPNIVRGKPGRGSRSQVVSCSDKITMWIACGLEGNYLSKFIHLELSSLLIGGGNKASCQRSLLKRVGKEECKELPIVCSESLWKSDISSSPSSSSFTWFLGGNAELIEPKFGRRVGVIQKNQLNPRFFPSMCDAMMAKHFCQKMDIKHSSILELKSQNEDYCHRKQNAKDILLTYGGEWSKKFVEEKEWIYDEEKMKPIFPTKEKKQQPKKQNEENAVQKEERCGEDEKKMKQ